jgi:hypothetical protein
MYKGKLESCNVKDPSNNRPMNKKGHGSVMAGKAVVRKSKKVSKR